MSIACLSWVGWSEVFLGELLGDFTKTGAESTSRQLHKFNCNDFAKSTYIAEIETCQEKMRKLITHVSFVH